jgi:hypothetical protein
VTVRSSTTGKNRGTTFSVFFPLNGIDEVRRTQSNTN